VTLSKNDRVTVELLNTLISYDRATQEMRWKNRPLQMFPSEKTWKAFNTTFAGKPAMVRVDAHGYRIGTISGMKFQAHRVVWALHYGCWPDGEIDHINGDKQDNRIENLRVVSHEQNCRNVRKTRRNTSGTVGVRFNRRQRSWVAFIGDQGECRHLGTFDTEADAVSARLSAARSKGYHPNHGLPVETKGAV